MDIWHFGARAQDLAGYLYSPSVDAAEQVRRQKIRAGFLELMRAIKETDVALFAVAAHQIGNHLEKAERPARAFDVVGGAEHQKRVEAEIDKATQRIIAGDHEVVTDEELADEH